ncbi:cpr-c2 [Symbiodinium sp. CCMP2456]|nr:cpr-c2 [Symbiodinium sp. CCMP2456]
MEYGWGLSFRRPTWTPTHIVQKTWGGRVRPCDPWLGIRGPLRAHYCNCYSGSLARISRSCCESRSCGSRPPQPRTPLIAWLCISAVFVIWLVFVAVAFCARKYHPDPTWFTFFSILAAICAVWGILAGLSNLREYEDPYYTLQEMRDAKGPNGTGVNPSLVSGEDVMDAGVLTFQQGSMFDADRTWHFMGSQSLGQPGFTVVTMVEMQPGICKMEFAMGSHGLTWKTGSTEVERVSCQARLLGVKPGWSISMIDGVPIETSYQAWNELMRCKKSGKKYQIYFTKDENSIREDQAKAEAEKARKAKQEEERKKREEIEKKIREEAEKKRADEIASKKQEYWDKQQAQQEEGKEEEGGPAPGAEEAAGSGSPAEAEGEGKAEATEAVEEQRAEAGEEAAPAEPPKEV